MLHPNILDKNKTALVVIDLQEAFRSAIPDFALIVEKTSIVIRGFSALDIPILVTEQYPKGLGKTVEEIALSLPNNAETFEKTTFSSCGASLFSERLKALNVPQIVVCGIEAHVCVNQTVHDLLNAGYQVQLLQDCVSSRSTHDKHTGIEKMKLSGAIPTNVEMALFELLHDSKHEKFKEIQGLVK